MAELKIIRGSDFLNAKLPPRPKRGVPRISLDDTTGMPPAPACQDFFRARDAALAYVSISLSPFRHGRHG